METPETQAEQGQRYIAHIDMLEAAHMERFMAGPLFAQAAKEGWADRLEAYARATVRHQAHLLHRPHPRTESPSVDYDAVLGQGTIAAIAAGDRDAHASLTQWKRQQHQNCVHGSISVQVPQDDIKRMVAAAVADQNQAASLADVSE